MRAGGSSQEKYDELTRAWRRRKRGLFLVVGAICAAVAVVSVALAFLWPAFAWGSGCVSGMAIAFFVIARVSPPGWIENWRDGVWGEQSTAKALRPLEERGWVVLHDLPTERGNVDHIVIGPGGVFLLDSKRPGGVVEVGATGVRVRRHECADLGYAHPGAGPLRASAAQTSAWVRERTRLSVWVEPVMVVWSEFPQRVVDAPGWHVVHGDELLGWLMARPTAIAPERVVRVATAVRAAWESGVVVG